MRTSTEKRRLFSVLVTLSSLCSAVLGGFGLATTRAQVACAACESHQTLRAQVDRYLERYNLEGGPGDVVHDTWGHAITGYGNEGQPTVTRGVSSIVVTYLSDVMQGGFERRLAGMSSSSDAAYAEVWTNWSSQHHEQVLYTVVGGRAVPVGTSFREEFERTYDRVAALLERNSMTLDELRRRIAAGDITSICVPNEWTTEPFRPNPYYSKRPGVVAADYPR